MVVPSDANFWARLPRPFTVLAPMEDVTDTVFRHLVAGRFAPDVFMSEFINAREYFHKKRKFARQRALIDPAEREFLGLLRLGESQSDSPRRPGTGPRPFLVAQIWGNDPEAYRKIIPILRESGFDGIDINMGCPAEKVVRRGECSGLIDRPSQAGELILAAQEAAGGAPVSVKTRLGVKTVKTEEWAGFLLGFDLPVLTIHGRIAAQMSEGQADWDAVRRVRELRDQMGKATLVVGNGDLFSAADLDRRHAETGVDGLMVGRGIFRDLDIFDRARPHRSFEDASWDDRRAVMVRHTEEHRRVWGGVKGFDMLKQFYKVYTRGPEVYLGLRERLFQTRTYDEALAVIAAWAPAP
jgi:tRNA-dihydrouridine synthase